MPTLRPIILILTVACGVSAQPKADPVPKGEPLLTLDGGGPTSPVTALAFSPDGNTVYAVGLDKLVRSWEHDLRTGRFRRTPSTFRVPIGPGLEGSLNALAVSADGRWLAVGGKSLARGTAGFRTDGRMTPPVGGMTPEMRLDQGSVFLFDLQRKSVKPLRGHTGAVLNLAFLPPRDGKPTLLVSVAQEWDSDQDEFVGGLRLWDVAKDEPLAKAVVPTASPDVRPGIAVWPAGNEAADVRAALTWDDGSLRVWNAATNDISTVADGVLNSSVAVNGSDRLITNTMTRDGGLLHAWTTTPTVARLASAQTLFPPIGGEFVFPRGLTLGSSTPGGPLDTAAVLLRTPKQQNRYELALVALAGPKANTVTARITLWNNGHMPTIVGVPGGKYLAVTGAADQAVRLYSIADLIAGKMVEPEMLRSDGERFRYCEFATDGKQTGLVLASKSGPNTANRKPPANLTETGVVFDAAQRKLVPFAPPWKLSTPADAGWSVSAGEPDDEKRITISVTHTRAAKGGITLPKTAVPTDVAVLPPTPPRNVPVVAVGYLDESRQPILALYNGLTGEKLRQLTAHQAATRRLAFSPDGTLLASVAADQKVCIWSLTDLNRTIGQRGRIEGLGVKTVNGKPQVARIEPGSPTAALLKPGDRIDGVVRGGKLEPLKGALSFYHAADGVKPGGTITLRLVGGNNVVVPVGQGVDERKPLVSLFVFRTADGRRDWVAWNPNGPYDTGTLKAERQFGWHLNPAEPGGPVVHAGANQYRAEFRKPGIVRHLLERGNLADALQDWDGPRVPRPKIGLGIDELGPAAPRRNGRILVRRPNLHLLAGVANSAFPADRIATMEWRLDDGPWRPFTGMEDAGRSRTADLSAAPWTRGNHELAVRLRSTGNRPEQFVESLPVVYVPAAPVIALAPDWRKATFGDGPLRPVIVKDKPRFRIEADISPGTPGEKLRVRLTVNDELIENVDMKFRETITLRKGPNRIVLEAENTSAPDGETAERTTVELEVTFAPDAPPPLIAFAPLEGDTTAPQPGRVVRVTEPVLPLSAYITAESPLTELTLEGKLIDGFTPGERQFLLDERVPLKPGRQTLTVSAKTKAGGKASPKLTFDYRPRLPSLVFTSPGPSVDFVAGRDEPEQTLTFQIVSPTDPQPMTMAVRHNERPMVAAKEVAADESELQFPITLVGGRNRVEITLANEWGASQTTIIELNYLRPPRVVTIDKPVTGPKPRFDLAMTVESPADRPLTRVLVNNRELPDDSIIRVKTVNGMVSCNVIAKAVPLDRGPNKFIVVPINADGPALEPGTVAVNFVPPVPPKAVIDLLDPGRDLTVEADRYVVVFRVRSASPLESVTIVRDDGQSVAINLANIVALPAGGFELNVNEPLALSAGANPMRVEALNAGGRQSVPLVITFLPPPVEILIDRLTDERGNEYEPKAGTDGFPFVARVPSSRLTVYGRVRWAEGVPGPRGQSRVRIWVNGFQQFPADLDAQADPNTRERTFSAVLVLNRRQDNHIDIHLPDLPVRDRADSHFHVRVCDAPQADQRLHLLVVGLGDHDAKAVKANAIAAIGATADPKRPDVLTAPRFAEVAVYGPLVGHVNRGVVNTQLALIQHAIRVRRSVASAAPIDEVVMVYYQGAEYADDAGYFLMTDDSTNYRTVRRQREVGIGEDDLAGFFSQTFGAQLLLLDVSRTAVLPAEPPGLLGESRGLGMIRTAWHGDHGEVPGDHHLLAVLARVGPAAATMRHLNELLGESIDRLATGYPPDSLRYDAFVPVSLEWLPFHSMDEPEK